VQPWVGASLGASVFVACHYLLLRAAAGKLGDALGALILEGTAALGIAAYYLVTAAASRASAASDSPTTRGGIAFSAASGLCISGASILLFYALRRGGPVAATGTVVLGGGVALSALVAPWIFAEGFTARRALGVALGLAAMAILSFDGAARGEQ